MKTRGSTEELTGRSYRNLAFKPSISFSETSTVRFLRSLGTLPRRFTRRSHRKHILDSQIRYLSDRNLSSYRRVVIFLIHDSSRIAGGRLQIFSMERVSRRLVGEDIAILTCWLPGCGMERCHAAGMPQDVVVCQLHDVIAACREDCQFIIHVPEVACERFVSRDLLRRSLRSLSQRRDIHINIMNQNNVRMPDPTFVHSMKSRFDRVTITTGHPDWSSPDAQSKWGVPIHWVPTWYYTDDVPWQPYESKLDLLIASPDRNPHRNRILSIIQEEMPNLDIRVIRDLAFTEYTKLERKAKWSLTFGEGNDGYFYGPIMRGGVSFAVRNDTFNHFDTRTWNTVYTSYDDMASRIVPTMKMLDGKVPYEDYNRRIRPHYSKYRSLEVLEQRLRDFYDGKLSLHPIHHPKEASS